MSILVLLVLLSSLPMAGTPIRLEARDQEGRPVAGVVVGLGSTTVGVTDEKGRLAFRLPRGRETPVRLLAPGGWWASGSLFAAAETEALVVIPLEPPRRVSGRVIDGATGKGIPDALVRAAVDPGASGRTDRLGGYSLAVPFAPAILYLRAEAPGYGDTIVAVGAAEKVPDTLVLRRVRGAVGQIVDAGGRPVPGAEVRLISWTSNPEGRPQAAAPVDVRTDAGGKLRVDRLPLGEVHLFVRASGFLPASKEAIQMLAGEGPADLGTVVLETAVALTGVVTDSQGHPLAGIESRCDEPQLQTTTESDGVFRLDGLRAGETVHLHFTGKGYVPASLTGLAVPTEPLKVVLRPAARIAGTVVDDSGDPIPGATLFVTREDGGMTGSAHSDAAGRFIVENVEPGTFRLSAIAPGFLPAVVAAKAEDIEEDIEIVLRRGAAVEGLITTAWDAPAAGAKVVVSDNGGQGLLAGLGLPETVTDEEGRYRLEGVAEGARSIRAEWPSLPPTVGELHVRPGSNRLDLRLQGGVEVSGRVTTSTGDPIEGVELALSPLQKTAISGSDGSFRFAAVPDGRYRLQGSRLGHTGSPREIQVAGAAIRDADLRLDSGGSLAGRITGLDPGALPQVEVRASSPLSRRDQVVRANPDGTYRLDDLGPGVWSVLAQIPQTSRSARGTVALVLGQEGKLDLDFGAGLTLSGRVERDGQPVERAWVTVQNGPTSGSALTSEDGRFRIEGLTPGPYAVIVVHPLSGLQSSHQLNLDRSLEISLDLATARPAGH